MDTHERSAAIHRRGGGNDIDAIFRDAFDQQRSDLLRYAQAWTRDPIAAEDICQESFARLYRALKAGQEPEVTGAWLRRVARNLAISRARRARVETRHVAKLHEPVGHDPTSREVIEREQLAAIRAALTRIPEPQRRLLLLAASGYSRAQLGEWLGASPGAVRTRLHRARRQLLGELSDAPGGG